MKSGKQNTLTSVLFVIYMLLLIGIILFKLPFYSSEISDGIRVINLIPYQGAISENGIILSHDIVYNFLMFVPFGIYISMLKNDWSFVKKLLLIIGLTFAFEVIQYAFAMGRTDITDIINNTFGGIVGIGIYAVLFKIFREKTNKIVNVIALIVTICVVLRFGYLFYLSNIVMRRLRP